jgi:hypothetical protein
MLAQLRRLRLENRRWRPEERSSNPHLHLKIHIGLRPDRLRPVSARVDQGSHDFLVNRLRHGTTPSALTDCPTTEAQLQTDLQSSFDVQIVCGQPTTISFTARIVFTGPPASWTIDASGSPGPVFFVGGHTSGQTNGTQFFGIGVNYGLTLNGLTLQNGYSGVGAGGAILNNGTLTVTGCTFLNNADGSSGGGAISSAAGTTGTPKLSVTNSTFSGNLATGGGYGGGAIQFIVGTMNVTNSTFTNNSTSDAGGGGAINVVLGSATVTGSTFTNNSSTATGTQGGGAIYSQGSLTVNSSTFSGNSSASVAGGGAITIAFATGSIDGSTFTNNSLSASAAAGGAIYADGTSVTVSNSTLSGNTARNYGGALFNAGTLTVKSSTLSANSAGTAGDAIATNSGSTITITVESSIIVNNQHDDCAFGFGSRFFDGGYNLTDRGGGDCGFSAGNNDQVNTNPKLEPLASNGGPTQTFALGYGSPAVDVIPSSSGLCPSTDQRGISRPDNGESSCDVGSYEQVEPINCPTYSQVQGLLTTPPATPNTQYLLSCSTPDTIDFSAAGAGTITPTQSVALDASGSPYPITFDGGGTTRLLTVNGGSLGLDGLTLTRGSAGSGYGGAIDIEGGAVTVADSTFSGNSAAGAGAILNQGTLTVSNSTFSGNSASEGGAIVSQGLPAPAVAVSNSTFSGNSAGSGGALVIFGGTLSLTGTIIAGSTNGGNCVIDYTDGALTSDGGYNLTDDGGAKCGLTASTDLLNTNPQLEPLAANGGPTPTTALAFGSPAVDAIPASSGICPSVDQRGVARPDNGESSCDVGAFEQVEPISCPTYGQIQSLLTTAPSVPNTQYLLSCSTADTIDFSAAGAGTITPTQSVTMDASGSPQPIIFDGGGTTPLLNVTGGTLTLDGLTLAHGAAPAGSAGAVSLNHGTLVMTNSTVSNNSAPSAGGILNHLGTLTVTNSTFSGNTATNYGGAIFNFGHTTISNSTFSGNSAGAGGGGAMFNNAGTITITASIIANSRTGGNCFNDTVDGAILTSGGYNLTDDTSCGFTDGANHDVVVNAGNAGLASQLGWNGGPTQTMALTAGSPAIDKIPSSLCLSTDQRGKPRPGDTANGNTYCDMGAFEAQHPLAFTLNASMTYGSALSLNGLGRTDPGSITFSPSITFSGDWNGDTAAQITGTTSGCTTTATSSSSVGTYPITGCTGFGLTGHDISFAGGTLTIKPADLMIMGANQRITYGSSIPALTWLEKTFVSSTVPVSLATQPTCRTAATSNSPVGSYSITCSGAGSPNYSFHYDQGVLTIAPASLVIAAKDATVVKGQPLPQLKFWANFVNHDSASSLLHRPMCKSPVKLDRSGKISSPAGTYPITCSGAKGKNYRIRYRKALLRVVRRMT